MRVQKGLRLCTRPPILPRAGLGVSTPSLPLHATPPRTPPVGFAIDIAENATQSSGQ